MARSAYNEDNMAEVPHSSFIPKRTTTTTVRRPRTYNFFVVGIVSYALFISAPVASAAVYVYHLYTERQLDAVVTEIDTAISDFNVADLQTVVTTDNRLRGAKTLLESHVSLPTALRILEEGTAETVAFETLAFERTDRNTVTVSGDLTATNFDAAIFQREEYNKNTLIAETKLEDLVFTPPNTEDITDLPDISVSGTFTFKTGTILYNPNTVTAAPSAQFDAGEMVDETGATSTQSQSDTTSSGATNSADPAVVEALQNSTSVVDPAVEAAASNDLSL